MATVHANARKNLTKSEFKLFEQSFPKELKKISPLRAKKAHRKTAELVKKYRASTKMAQDPVRQRLLSFRLKSLEKTLTRYSESINKERSDAHKAKSKRPQKSLTAQPKMHVERKDSPREKFLRQGKLQEYQKHTQGIREENTPGKLADKRILGYSESNSRKGQIARDRGNAFPEKEK
ncbi:MAG: hypothetical protein ACM3MG_10595 [Bacillota bacterium]